MIQRATSSSCVRLAAWALAAAIGAAGPAQAMDDPMLELLRERGLVAQQPEHVAGRLQAAAAGLVLAAMNFLDVRYQYGGNTPAEGFDCSGFTRHVFATVLGLSLPRRSDEQAHQPGWQQVTQDDLQPGDLVFFNTMRRAFSHVGIYIGEGRFIHSPRSGAQVRIETMDSSYWRRRFDGARRAAAVAISTVPSRP